MAVRRDQVQLDVSFITDESRAFAKQIEANKQFVKDLRTAQREGKGLDRVLGQISDSAQDIEDIDLTNVAPRQLIDRARQLKRALDLIPQSAPQAAKLRDQYKRINDQLAEVRRSTRGVVQESSRLGSIARGALSVFGGITLAGIVSGIGRIGQRIVGVTADFEKFEAVLTNALGSRSQAQSALRQIQDFAAQTPFQVEELIGSYVKLVNRGIQPTQEELRRLGDIAASQGKSFDQLVEAVLDATTGEFERLKEFGIRAKAAGDQVELAFRGQTLTVEKSDEAIKNAILSFGDLNGVAGSTAAISRTLGGRISNLTDSVTQLLARIGNSGLGRVLGDLIGGFTSLINRVTGLIPANDKASDSVRDLQAQFNIEIETLKRGNLSQENRARLIDQINQRYGEYLPNLLDETSSLEDITTAQNAANEAFRQRIVLLAAEEQFVDVNKRLLAAKREELDLQQRLSRQQADLEKVRADAEERQRKNLPNVNRGIEQQGVIIGKTNIAIRENQAEQQRLQAEYEKTAAAARELGVDIDALIAPPSGGGGGGGGGGAGGRSLEDRLRERLAAIEADFARQEVLLERSLLLRETTESEYGRRLLEIKRAQYQAQLGAFEQFNQSQSVEAEKARNELIRIQQALATRNPRTTDTLSSREPGSVSRDAVSSTVDLVNQGRDNALERLREKFRAAIIAEQDYELRRLEIKRQALATEIALLRSGNEAQQRLAQERNQELITLDEQLVQQRLENRRREQELQQRIQQAGLSATQDFFEISADLLAQDEAARKKNAKAIAAFERGRVIVAGAQEVQRIWAEAASLGPIAGPIIGGVQSALAIARTALALSKIDGAKFARGGMAKFGFFGGRPHSQGGTRGYFDDGTAIEVEKDEAFAIVNKRSSGVLRALSTLNQAGGGVPFFAGGGIPNTTPSTRAQAAVSPANAMPDIGALLGEVRALRTAFAEYPTRLRADVVYTDIESVGAELSTVRSSAEI